MTTESKLPLVLLLMLTGIVLSLMVAIIGLFVRMNQLQEAVLAALAAPPAGATMQDVGLEVGTPAPALILPDPDGTPISLADFAGRRVLLVFSSVSCPACTEMYPHLRAFSEAHREVQVVMVSRGAAEENRALVEEQGFAFPVLMWEDGVAQEYRVPGTPFFYVVDGEGVIANKGFGNTQAQLEALVGGRAE
jgi:peroxiredoxin Q/BCP